jgi:hypothetical protein
VLLFIQQSSSISQMVWPQLVLRDGGSTFFLSRRMKGKRKIFCNIIDKKAKAFSLRKIFNWKL